MDTDMDKNVSNAREIVAMRNHLHSGLTPAELRAVNWQAIVNVAVHAINRGWTGHELADWALASLSDETLNVGGAMHKTLSDLAESDPPRPKPTPQPPPVAEVLRLMRADPDEPGWGT